MIDSFEDQPSTQPTPSDAGATDGGAVTYSLSGTDAALFEINATKRVEYRRVVD